MLCMTCDLATASENFLVCSGLCKKVVHYKCAGLRKAAFDLINGSENICWFCDSCKFIYNLHVTKLCELTEVTRNIDISLQSITDKMSISQPIVRADVEDNSVAGAHNQACAMGTSTQLAAVELQTASANSVIVKNNTTDNFIESSEIILPSAMQNSSSSTTRTFAEVASSSLNSSAVLPEVNKSHASFGACTTFAEVVKNPAVMPVTTSTTLTSHSGAPDQPSKYINASEVKVKTPHRIISKPICGTKNIPVNFVIQTVTPMFWIHLSRFVPNTPEDDILAMAKTCLDTDNCKITKLVPKNYNLNDLEYVCFKLGFKEELRDKALDPATWPIGILVRKFDNKNFRASLTPRVKFRIPAVIDTPLR